MMDLTAHPCFVDTEGLRLATNLKASGGRPIPTIGMGVSERISQIHRANHPKTFGQDAAVSMPNHNRRIAPRAHQSSIEGLSPFLTAEEQIKLATDSGIILHPLNIVNSLEREPFIDTFQKNPDNIPKAPEPPRGFELLSNQESVQSVTKTQLTIKRDGDGGLAWSETIASMPVQPSKIEDSAFQETLAFSTIKPQVVEDEAYLPMRKLTNVKEWNRYLFDQMINGDVGFSKQHLDGIKEEIYNKLKLIHMGHKSSRENTKNLLDMYDFLKAPSGPVKVEDSTKLEKGAKIAELFKNGISELLGLSKSFRK